MAARKTNRRRSSASRQKRRKHNTTARRSNRRRYTRRRRHNPVMARRRSTAAVNPRRRSNKRHYHRRRHNPSFGGIGQIVRAVLYGSGGALLTRVGSSVVKGFLPGVIPNTPFTGPLIQVGVSAFGVHWLVKKVFGPAQADIARLGGFISAGLELIDNTIPGLQSQLTGIMHLPVQVAPGLTADQMAAAQQGAANGAAQALNGFRDVEEVPDNIFGSQFSGFGDVEELDPGFFPGTSFE